MDKEVVEKRAYAPPCLVRYGDVKAITKAVSDMSMEPDSALPGMNKSS